jgi:hypothetical protein
MVGGGQVQDGQRQQQPKQQAHDDQHEDISFHGDARDVRATASFPTANASNRIGRY